MLSRSNSTAGDRLRRAKSTSSHKTTSSGHHRSSTSTDPFAVRQQAEVAAVEAYTRARQYEEQTSRPAPKLQRRRSQTTGRVEGSHFEDARLGRRRSTSTRAENRAPQPRRSQPPTVIENSADGAGEEKIITRKRSVIPPSSATTQTQREHLTVPSTTSQRTRKSQSVYADGSPAPRRSAPLTHRSSTLQLSSPPVNEYTDGYGGNLAHLSDFGEPTATALTFKSPKPSVRETQTDDEILALARDKCLQDFQQRKVRERKSFLLAPFQKRRATNFFKSSDGNYDTTLPPFNYADDETQAPLPPAPNPPLIVPVTVTKADRRSRNISETLKGRIKKAFRKASRVPSDLPAQHVEAKHFHYDTSEEANPPVSQQSADPFVTVIEETPLATSEQKTESANSRSSAGQFSETRSRVTSWTNSTIAGTCTSRAEVDYLAPVEEHGGLRRSNSMSTLRKAKSFFGRPVQNRLRRPSKVELNTSEESQDLYSALQQRMKPSRRTSTPDTATAGADAQEQHSRVSSGLASLPSQRPASNTISSKKGHSPPTVRSVTPDQKSYRLGVCSPVEEILSPDTVMAAAAGFASSCLQPGEQSTSILLQRPLATKAPAPSQEQLQRRMEKSKNRWQSPLGELSPHPTRADMDENPYELRSLSLSHQQPKVGNDLPHHAKVGDRLDAANRANMLSPSVYSRATDGVSPRPFTPTEQGGMVVTITGREVRRYSISPPKQVHDTERPAQTSGQWRRWLSDEMHGFKSPQEDFNLAQAFLGGNGAIRSRSTSGQESGQSDCARPASISPPVDARPASTATSGRPQPTSTGRPRASSRRSSFMNERYPMVDTSRNSSDQSIKSRNVYSRAGSSNEQVHTIRPSIDSVPQKASFTRQRVVAGRASIAQMQTTSRDRSTMISYESNGCDLMSGAIPDDPEPATSSDNSTLPVDKKALKTNRHKSAFELRANYKNTTTGRSTPLEIRRKPMNDNTNILEDNTIRNISAGPYASHQLSAAAFGTSNRGDNKENTPPSDANSLLALSSSEWLAAGPNKSQKPSAVHPAYRNRSVSRYSPPKGTSYHMSKGDGKGSPAQRMASEWLQKRSRDSTPAFV